MMQHSDTGFRRSGFTLIELLVVVAIIAVLAALMFGVTKSIQMKQKQTFSMNNLRQWGGALSASLQDSNGCLPSDGDSGKVVLKEESAWFNRLPPYMGLKRLMDMTEAEYPQVGRRSSWVNPAATTTSKSKPLFFYGINYYFSAGDLQELPFSRIEFPAATVWMAEGGVARPIVSPGLARAYFGTGGSTTGMDNTASFLFCDGHVAQVKRSVFSSDAASKDGSDGSSNPIDQTFTWVPYTGARQN